MKRPSNTRPLEDPPALPFRPVPRSMDGAISPNQARLYDRSRTIILPPAASLKSTPASTIPSARSTTPVPKTKITRPVKAKRSLSGAVIALIVGAILILSLGGWVLATTILTNRQASRQINQISQTSPSSTTSSSPEIPDEKPVAVNAYGSYVVAADQPRYLRIPKFGVKARVVRLGVLNNGELATPRSIWDVGWYEGSSKPGEAGAALLAGHYSGPTQPGAFAKINGLVAGDIFAIEKGNGTVLNYEVVKTETLPNDQVSMAKALVTTTPGKKGLNFITCAGQYSTKTNNYAKRTVVYSVEL